MGCSASSDTPDVKAKKPVDVSEEMLSDYLRIEREITEAEIQNPLKPLDLKADQMVQLSDKMEELQLKLKDLKHQTNSSEISSDEVETHKFLIENGVDDELNPQQQKHLDLLNEKEIVVRELKANKDQYRQVTKEVNSLKRKAEHLEQLYMKQDSLLDNIFGGKYGSLRENQVEMELDHLKGQRERILEANFKWRQGQMMLEYACKQLSISVKKWQDLTHIPLKDVESRYGIAAETRNNIIAAGQNISGAQRYLHKIQFPYCSPGEVETLSKAAQYVFTDMQSTERHSHAMECYRTTHKRANALLQWFDTVINSTIMKDLQEINDKVKAKSLELRKERVRLIKKKVKEHFGTDVHLEQTLRDRHISATELAKAHLYDNEVVKVDHFGGTQKGITTPPLLSTSELAPVPSESAIFGKSYKNQKDEINRLAEQHQEELQTFLKGQEVNEKRIKGNLEETLMNRRQRRARLKIEKREKEFLKS